MARQRLRIGGRRGAKPHIINARPFYNSEKEGDEGKGVV